MVASKMLRNIFQEKELYSYLLSACSRRDLNELYTTTFGGMDEALIRAPLFENPASALPLGSHKGGGIPYKNLRRILNHKVAAVACFFALACYDAQSINFAYALLQKRMECGDVIRDEEELFPNHELVNLFDNEGKSYIFEQFRLEVGNMFVKNVVDPANRFMEFLHLNAKFGRGNARPNQLGHLQYFLCRTLCSDLMEIYASHGGYPRSTVLTLTAHPLLKILIAKHEGKRKPIPLLL
jgi:hypothetical protein